MTNGQSNKSLDDETTHNIDGVATLSVTSPNAASENQNFSDKSADSASSATSFVQSPPSRPLWNTREGRIAGYKRTIEKSLFPENRANFEALIRYYEDGGKVPEGDEEVWAFDGQASFGIRNYTRFDQMPEGWLNKHRYCDVSGFCLCRYWFRGLLLSFLFVSLLTPLCSSFLELEILSNQLLP